jgi:hypothetical protein
MNDSYIQIGHTGKPHGITGELKIVVKERYERDALQANVLFLDLKGSPVPFFVEDLNIGNAWIVKFEDVDSREHANSISGKGIFLRQTDLLPPEAADPMPNPTTNSWWATISLTTKPARLAPSKPFTTLAPRRWPACAIRIGKYWCPCTPTSSWTSGKTSASWSWICRWGFWSCEFRLTFAAW